MGMTVVVFVFFWFGRGFWVCGGMGSRRVRGSHGWVVLLAVDSYGVMGLGYFGTWVMNQCLDLGIFVIGFLWLLSRWYWWWCCLVFLGSWFGGACV